MFYLIRLFPPCGIGDWRLAFAMKALAIIHHYLYFSNIMSLIIRQEQTEDHLAVERIIEEAFANEAFSDQSEHHLVARLRTSEAFVPELSLVAELEGKIVGHILFTKITIGTSDSLALAPVSVKPKFQGQGIGSQLITHGHEVAKKLGFGSAVLLGHAGYYPRFGYEKASDFNIHIPFDKRSMFSKIDGRFLDTGN